MLRNPRLRLAIACAATLLIVGPLAWLWQASLLPDAYSIMDMGYADGGGHPPANSTMDGAHAAHGGGVRSIVSLTANPDRHPDVTVTLTARKQRYRLASGREVDGYTLNGQSPGPLIQARLGQLVQVRLVNESVPDGITLDAQGRVWSAMFGGKALWLCAEGRGVIDRLELDEHGEFVITDYKTGGVPSERYEGKSLSGVHIYALLCERMLGKRPARVQLLYLQKPEAIIATPSDQTITGVERRASALWTAISTACSRDDFRPHPSRLCDFCAFKAYCPAFGGDPVEAAELRGPGTMIEHPLPLDQPAELEQSLPLANA